MLPDRPSVRTLMIVLGFVGLRKQGETQNSRDGRDTILRRGQTNDEKLP